MKNKQYLAIVSIFLCFICGCEKASTIDSLSLKAQNIIFFIGDGMGVAQVSATSIRNSGADCYLTMEKMPITGLVKTHSAENLITDSAAAGTALASGYKTRNGMINVTPDSLKVQTIVQASQLAGKKTGVIATASITHATPAAMASHVYARGNQQAIAAQLLENKVQVLLGGGLRYFIADSAQGGIRADERNLVEEARNAGYTFVRSADELDAADSDYVLGLFALNALSGEAQEPSLAEMTQKALGLLDKNGNGFFLMVEGSQIDWEGHDNDAAGVYAQTLQFDAAVKVALDFAEKDGNTLVIVTADHETGGMAINGGQLDGEELRIAWTTGGHTGIMVPVFAYGSGCAKFSGVYDNTRIPLLFAEAFGIENFPRVLQEKYKL